MLFLDANRIRRRIERQHPSWFVLVVQASSPTFGLDFVVVFQTSTCAPRHVLLSRSDEALIPTLVLE